MTKLTNQKIEKTLCLNGHTDSLVTITELLCFLKDTKLLKEYSLKV